MNLPIIHLHKKNSKLNIYHLSLMRKDKTNIKYQRLRKIFWKKKKILAQYNFSLQYIIFERLPENLHPIQGENEPLIPSNKTWQHVLTRIDYTVRDTAVVETLCYAQQTYPPSDHSSSARATARKKTEREREKAVPKIPQRSTER